MFVCVYFFCVFVNFLCNKMCEFSQSFQLDRGFVRCIVQGFALAPAVHGTMSAGESECKDPACDFSVQKGTLINRSIV